MGDPGRERGLADPGPGYGWRTMNRTSVISVSLHHRRENQKCAGVNRDTDKEQYRETDACDHQDAPERLGVLVHSARLPRPGWSLTDGLANARSTHG